jgi:hypothetical protein
MKFLGENGRTPFFHEVFLSSTRTQRSTTTEFWWGTALLAVTARPVELHISGQILGVEYIDRNHCREKQLVGGFKYVLPSGNRGNWKSPWPSHGGLVRKIVHQWGSFPANHPHFLRTRMLRSQVAVGRVGLWPSPQQTLCWVHGWPREAADDAQVEGDWYCSRTKQI